jgi:hypothetical protein
MFMAPQRTIEIPWRTVEVGDVTVVHVYVYKPPSSSWSRNTLKVLPRLTIYVGDFNCHNGAMITAT